MARIGYARVSTKEQNLAVQIKALEKAGCPRIFTDHGVSAIARCRPGFEAAMKALGRGDSLVIWKMDRAFRSVLHAAAALEEFQMHGMTLECLTERIDMDSAFGRYTYHTRSAACAFERELISERTLAGLALARKRGSVLGRPRKLSERQIGEIRERLRREPDTRTRDMASAYGVSPRTVRRGLVHRPYPLNPTL